MIAHRCISTSMAELNVAAIPICSETSNHSSGNGAVRACSAGPITKANAAPPITASTATQPSQRGSESVLTLARS